MDVLILIREEESGVPHGLNVHGSYLCDHWEVFNCFSENETMMVRQVSGDGFNGFRVHSCCPRHGFEVAFVGEVEKEDVVGLTIDVFSYGVRLIGHEGGENSEVPHPRNDVFPVGFPQIKVSLLRN